MYFERKLNFNINKIARNNLIKEYRRWVIMTVILNFFCLSNIYGQEKTDTITSVSNNVIFFKDVEVPPTFSECDRWEEICEIRNCFERSILERIKKHIRNGFAKENKEVVRTLRVALTFEISDTGAFEKIEIKGEDEVLNKYIKQAIATNSKILPGKNKGSNVSVLYSLKIKLIPRERDDADLEDKNLFFIREDLGDIEVVDTSKYPYALHPDCLETGEKEKDKKCSSYKIRKFVSENFDTRLGTELGLSGITRIYVNYKVTQCGNIIDIKARGPHPRLEKEAARVVKLLPKLKIINPQPNAGKQNITYNLPIAFFANQ